MYSDNNNTYTFYTDNGIGYIPNIYFDVGSNNFNKITSHNSVHSEFINADFINTPKLDITHSLIFSNKANIYFNVNSLREEINTPYNTTMFHLSY